MSTLQYLFGFHGRINRAKVWLYLLIAIGFGIVIGIIAAFAFDITATVNAIKDQAFAGRGHIDWSKVPIPAMRGPASYVALALIVVLYLTTIWIHLAVYAKRLHDRDRSAWWLLVYVGLPGLLNSYNMHGHGMPGTGAASGIATLIVLWVFIDLWCLRGTRGSNPYGVDPLAGGPVFCEPNNPVYGCVPKS